MTDEARQIKLLIVDDDSAFLDTIAERLGMRDFDVTTAAEGPAAIQAAKSAQFDVAILDLRMPGMDGMELLQILKQNHKFLEVIMLTGHASAETETEAAQLGAFSYIEKPYDFESLIEALKKAYETRLRKKFEHDKERMREIENLAIGSDPLAILRSLTLMDDDVK
jgi:two-component system NtrC family response regulator